jgi:DNA-binding IscR family transcriptional regulator
LASDLGVPSRLISQTGQALLQSKLIVEVLDGETGYAPARPLDRISAHDILQALRTGQGQEPATADDPERTRVRKEFDRVADAERQAAGSVTLLALVEATQDASRLAAAAPAT